MVRNVTAYLGEFLYVTVMWLFLSIFDDKSSLVHLVIPENMLLQAHVCAELLLTAMERVSPDGRPTPYLQTALNTPTLVLI